MSYIKHPIIKPDKIKLRKYQESVVAGAIEDNTLVVLPTGLGKTIIAAMLAAHRLNIFPGKKVLFLAPTRPLVVQHKETFKDILAVENMEVLTGKDAPAKRAEAYENNNIIFATPQTVENDIMRGLSLKNFSLIIFDEAHRAAGNYAYSYIAEEYVNSAKDRLIIGLTASPGSNKEKIREVAKNLFIRQVLAKTEDDKDVKPYIMEMKIDWIKVELPGRFDEMRKIIKEILKDELSALKHKNYIRSAGVDAANKGELLKAQGIIQKEISEGLSSYTEASIVASAIKVIHALELLETQGISALVNYLERLRTQKSKAVRNLMIDPRVKLLIRAAGELKKEGIEHPKVARVVEIVKRQKEKNNEIKILIFTQYRDSVDKIIEKLNEADILAHEFIGQAARADKAGMSQKKQIEILNKFKEGEYTALVCTSVHPDEYIVVKDPCRRIKIESIGEFVESFLNPGNYSKKIKNWQVLSSNGKEVDFYPITRVHKHLRKSDVVKIKLHGGAESLITEDHSIFTFNGNGEHVAAIPEKNLFVNTAYFAPNIEEIKKIDIVKEFLDHAPRTIIDKLFCTFEDINQPRIRMLSSDLKVLKKLSEKKSKRAYKSELSGKTNLDVSTILDVIKRLKYQGCVKEWKEGRYCFSRITPSGEEYLTFLKWFFKKHYYWKKKYRISLQDVILAPGYIDKFCKLHVEFLYGKTRVPRYMEVNCELAGFLGFYVSEGSARKTDKTSDVLLSARNKEMQKRMSKSVKDGLLLDPSIDWKGVHIYSQMAFLLVKYVFRCGIGAYKKEVPSVIFSSPEEQKWKFLEAYFLGDGHLADKIIVLTTASRKLVTGLYFLLRQLGVKKLTIRRDHAYRLSIYESLPFAKITHKSRGTRKYYDLIPTALISDKSFRKFGNKYAKTNTKPKARTIGKVDNDSCFDFIKELKKVEKQPEFVYDLSVKGTERFFGGPGLICLHNSVAEEGLDIPKVDLVIFYEPIPSEIRSIQRRGRTGRSEAGRVIILITKNTRDEGFYWAGFHKERRMKSEIDGMKKLNEIDFSSGQQSLITYGSEEVNKNNKIKIFVDARERNSEISKILRRSADVKVSQLPVGDYILSDRVCVERKTVYDFVQSIIDKRLMQQASELSKNFAIPIIMVEGAQNMYGIRQIHPNAIRGAIASLAVNFKISIIPTQNEEDTANLLYIIAKREQEDEERTVALRGEKKVMSMPEKQQFIVESLPNVSAVLARRLLEHFGSVQNVVNAGEFELKQVEGIGAVKAREIRQVVKSQYEKFKNKEGERKTK